MPTCSQYIERSSPGPDQNTVRQREGIELDQVFTDKASGKDTKLVHSMDRLARTLDDLRSSVQRLTKKGVRIGFVKEQLVFTGEDSPPVNLMLSVRGPSRSSNVP